MGFFRSKICEVFDVFQEKTYFVLHILEWSPKRFTGVMSINDWDLPKFIVDCKIKELVVRSCIFRYCPKLPQIPITLWDVDEDEYVVARLTAFFNTYEQAFNFHKKLYQGVILKKYVKCKKCGIFWKITVFKK